MGISMELAPYFAATTAAALVERDSTRDWSVSVEMCADLVKRALVKSDVDVG